MRFARRVVGALVALLGLVIAGVGAVGPVVVCIYLVVGPWGWMFAAVPAGIVVAVIAIRGGTRLIDDGISRMVRPAE